MITICIFAAFLASGIASDFDPTRHKNWNLLPHDVCGEVSTSRIIGGAEAPMNAYPWIARIGYSEPLVQGFVFRCGGALVNAKTVLTAAHCVSYLPVGFKVGIVRFGEHNVNTNPDCENDFCADPIIDIEPIEILVHYNYNNPAYKNDIALMRLEKSLKFSAFIKPICLPGSKKDNIGIITEVAGWGIYDLDHPRNSDTLKVVKIPIVSNKKCAQYMPSSIHIGPTQLCAGGMIGMDSCGGDSGGPLMKVDDGNKGPRYYLLGIVSFGSKDCGKTKMPGVYTRVYEYMKWFLDNLKERDINSTIIVPP